MNPRIAFSASVRHENGDIVAGVADVIDPEAGRVLVPG
jgi:hypothetical protein